MDLGVYRGLEGASRREEVLLAQLTCAHVWSLCLTAGNTKRDSGADSMFRRCGEVKETLEPAVQRCQNWDSPRRRNFGKALPPLLVLTTDQLAAARYFQEVFDI
jgi:hypothetical protein